MIDEKSLPDLFVATVGQRGSYSTGWSLILPGETEETQKLYRSCYRATANTGYKVLVAKVSGTYIIIDRIYP